MDKKKIEDSRTIKKKNWIKPEIKKVWKENIGWTGFTLRSIVGT